MDSDNGFIFGYNADSLLNFILINLLIKLTLYLIDLFFTLLLMTTLYICTILFEDVHFSDDLQEVITTKFNNQLIFKT